MPLPSAARLPARCGKIAIGRLFESNHSEPPYVRPAMIRSKLAILAAALVALAVLAVPVSAAFKHQVTIKEGAAGYHFKPQKISIKTGQTVHWTWKSDEPHNVTFGQKLNGKHSKTRKSIDNFHVTFNKAGTYRYTCTVHAFAGKVVVTDPS
jgi:plastocyanin